MTFDQSFLVIGISIIVIFLATCIPLTILDIKKNKHKYITTKEELREWEDKRLNDEGEVVTLHAEVVDMTCGVKMLPYQSYKLPQSVKQFIITFKTDDGNIITLPVLEEMYDGFEIGLVGTLTTIDGKLDSFQLDPSS